MVNIDDIRNYKDCRKKLYDIYVAKPTKGDIFINKLEMPVVYNKYKGYVPLSERFCLGEHQNIGYKVTEEKPYVLAGTVCEMWNITEDKLFSTYNFITKDGVEPITKDTLAKKLKGKQTLDWTPIKSKPNNDITMACFVPKNQTGTVMTAWGAPLTYNDPSVPHGRGDFIVCAKNPDGTPNLNDRWVVNGLIFAVTYNNTTWTEYLDLEATKNSITKTDLPKLELTEINTITNEGYFNYAKLINNAFRGKTQIDTYRSKFAFRIPNFDVNKYPDLTENELIKKYSDGCGVYVDKVLTNMQEIVDSTKIIKDISIPHFDAELWENNIKLHHLFFTSLLTIAYLKAVTILDNTLNAHARDMQIDIIRKILFGLFPVEENTDFYVNKSPNTISYYATYLRLDHIHIRKIKSTDNKLKTNITFSKGEYSRIDTSIKNFSNVKEVVNQLYKDIFVYVLDKIYRKSYNQEKYSYDILEFKLGGLTKRSDCTNGPDGSILNLYYLNRSYKGNNKFSYYLDGLTLHASFCDGTTRTYTLSVRDTMDRLVKVVYEDLLISLGNDYSSAHYKDPKAWKDLEFTVNSTDRENMDKTLKFLGNKMNGQVVLIKIGIFDKDTQINEHILTLNTDTMDIEITDVLFSKINHVKELLNILVNLLK